MYGVKGEDIASKYTRDPLNKTEAPEVGGNYSGNQITEILKTDSTTY